MYESMKFSVCGSTTSYMSRNLPAIEKKKLHHASRTGREGEIERKRRKSKIKREIGESDRPIISKVERFQKIFFEEVCISLCPTLNFLLCVREKVVGKYTNNIFQVLIFKNPIRVQALQMPLWMCLSVCALTFQRCFLVVLGKI